MKKVIFTVLSFLYVFTFHATAASVTELKVSVPSSTLVADKNIQLKAFALLSDGQMRDVTSSVTWEVDDDSLVEISNTGEMSRPNSELEGSTNIQAVHNGMPSSTHQINSCVSLASECLGVVTYEIDDISPVMFTAAPSRAFADSIGFFDGVTLTEDGTKGPPGDYVMLSWQKDGSGDSRKWCEMLAEQAFMGRTDWHLFKVAGFLQLIDFVNTSRHDGLNWYEVYGWPTGRWYHTDDAIADGQSIKYSLYDKTTKLEHPSDNGYPTCASGNTDFFEDLM